MTPVVFDNCAGWFHPAHTNGTAVLLCSGISQDYCNGYRPFRLLANDLARAGYPALRFDYRGTGESADSEHVNLWEVWQKNLAVAASWLLAHTGARRLLLIGLRIGGTLAAMTAAQRRDIAGLVLIEPCLTGRAYVSQLVTEARLRGAQQPDSSIEVGELTFTPECLDQMRSAELAKLTLPPALPVAIFSYASEEKIITRLATWKAQSIKLNCGPLEGLEAMLRPSHHFGDPELDSSSLLEWLHREIPTNASSPCVMPCLPKPEALILPGCMETILRFGATWHLTGTLCRPRLDGIPGFAVLICNAGGNPRHGFARFGVECARALAKAGITSLRFDFAGLGDSIYYNKGADFQTDVFAEDRAADIRAAVDALEALGFICFALHGLCSGAYHAVRGACADPRITQLLAINLPWFSLQHERPGPDSVAQNCMRILASRNTASLFLFGEQDAGLKLFERHFGPGGSLLPASPLNQLRIAPGLDHELTVDWMRRAVITQMIDFIQTHQVEPPPERRRSASIWPCVIQSWK